ncbi:Pisatin demethylase [Diplodia seriata]|uniref:Pisatin demethylase n=1 Tax=Diplodia seriata TaxID=420778 RepID=A0A1S8B6I8_9PEZI|nr:Pisatin demethylase [Diplodia seriata]
MSLLSRLSSADVGRATIWLLLLPLVYFVVLVLYRAYNAFFGPLRSIPGPWLAKFTGLWELGALWNGDFEQQNIAVHKQHGKVVRIGPNKYSIDDPDAVRIIYGHGTKFTKTDFYGAFRDPHMSNLFAELDVKEHSTQRRRIASLYSMTTLLSYESFIDSCTTILMDKFNKFAREHRPVEMVEWLQFYAFDVIGAITTSSTFGLMTAECDSASIIAAIATDFLTKLLRLEAPAGPNTPFDTFNAAGSNIAAGSDTTAITLSAALYHLLRNPSALARLRAELAAARAAGEASDPITYAEAQRCEYLQAVLKETLRMHPAVGQPMMRRVPVGGPGVEVVPGTWLPAGAEVGVNPWVAHRNEGVWGRDAGVFRPERWLEERDDATRARMEGYSLAFGHGSRTCIGKHISLLEISKVIPQLVMNFDFEFVEPEKEWETKTAWFCKQKYQCYIKARRA